MRPINEFLERDERYEPKAFVVIKPGFIDRGPQIIDIFAREGWMLKKIRTTRLVPSQARELYKPHSKEEWYKDLCAYMSSGPSTALILQKSFDRKGDPREVRRKALEEVAAIKDRIRKMWGESEMRNVLHSTDDPARIRTEAGIYF